MGYELNSIFSISPDDTHSYFVFLVGGDFKTSVTGWLNENFKAIARRLGPKAVIVQGISCGFAEEVIEIYQEDIDGSINDLLRDYEGTYSVACPYAPFLFITDRNPHHSANNGKGVFYLIPLDEVNGESETQRLVQVIIECIITDDFSPLESWVKSKSKTWRSNLLHVVNDCVELKPNVAGVGLNLNRVIDWFMKTYR